MKELNNYQPISCNFYDELTLLAMRKQTCEIVYRVSERKITTTTSIIRDIYTKDKKEFMILETGLAIRLDALISVDGKILKDYC